ncbi:MAG: cysteine desulfurase [Ruminococcus sp.]|nr:cysteine desulfurase [Ruminococcus sp.]
MEIYFDNAATTRPCKEAVEAITRCLTETYGNPSSLHGVGLAAQLVMDEARKTIAGAIGASAEEILFTSGATESTAIALHGIAHTYGRHNRRIITTTVEHASVRETCNHLEEEGFEVVRIRPREDGKFDPADFVSAVNDKTCLLTMMLVNNETGTILPVEQVFRAVKRANPKIITHCDAVQGFLKLPFRVSGLQADLLSLSGHKIYAAKGIGALYIRKGVRVSPLIHGGKQEKGLRPGTESVPLIAGMGAAVRIHLPTIAERASAAAELRTYLLERLSSLDEITINSPADGLPYIVNFSVQGIRSEILLHFLEERGISVSSGSACSKGANSGVLGEFGVKPQLADSALRISFCHNNTKTEIDTLIEMIKIGQNTLHRAK